jgi:hypothetical protein
MPNLIHLPNYGSSNVFISDNWGNAQNIYICTVKRNPDEHRGSRQDQHEVENFKWDLRKILVHFSLEYARLEKINLL